MHKTAEEKMYKLLSGFNDRFGNFNGYGGFSTGSVIFRRRKFRLGSTESILSSTSIQIFEWMGLFGQHLDAWVNVDGDGTAGNEHFLGCTVIFIYGDNSWFQDSCNISNNNNNNINNFSDLLESCDSWMLTDFYE